MMHELSLCRGILDIIEQQAIENKSACVKKVYLEIGQLVAVDKSALMLSFNLLKQGTVAEKATLNIIDVAGLARCESCGKQVHVTQYYDACSACGGFSLTVLQGDELRVKSMEIE